MNKARQLYLLALLLTLLMHGSLISFTLPNTYDAYVHLFFGSHYAESWFEPWNYKWYTGFTMTSYPPLVHQVIALLSKAIGLKLAFITWALGAVALFIRGVFHFSKIWVSKIAAGYACWVAMLCTSYIEAVHIFGQLPSITGLALLLNACPELYKWIRYNRWSYFFTGLSIIACLTCAHHVTTIFGMVFFIAPVLGVAVLDICIEEKKGIDNVRILDFILKVKQLLPKAILIGISVITITVCMIFPYWYWSKTDPITQVSIPHGSRASFLEKPSLGLVFFLIPWGTMLLFLPPIFYKIFKKRNLFLGLSFALLFVLGTGGTTPIPKMLLGENAFNILTLDRFTFWATIVAIPFTGQLMYSLIEGKLSKVITQTSGKFIHRAIIVVILTSMVIAAALTINFSNYKSLQPDTVEIDPIVKFLGTDGHERWRFMTLGFGDQMAWLSAHTEALSVDGNYHSARRLPELTTRAVERIENSKYLGEEGLLALRDFLSSPEKYNLKYVFSNDKFYEPLLFFYGWKKLKPLENNIDIWERKDIPPLPNILLKKDIPLIQKLLWGTLPIGSLIFALLLNGSVWFVRKEDRENLSIQTPRYTTSKTAYIIYTLWVAGIISVGTLATYSYHKNKQPHSDPLELIYSYYHALDFKKFKEAYSYLDQTDYTYEQYTLEQSLEDGILASYAKLDTIEITAIRDINKSKKEIELSANWFTAVQKYQTQHKHLVIKKNDKWLIKKETYEKSTPPDQFINIPDLNFLDQGRRKADITTSIDDVLDRPEIYISEANMLKSDSSYHIVGTLTNIDNVPAFVTIEGVLYDNDNKELQRANADEIIIHNLLPKETTPFRIDFKDWERKENGNSEILEVADFVLFARSTVTDEKVYKFTGIRNLSMGDEKIKGWLDNYGNTEISIPQILTAQYKSDDLLWVEATYINKGIRPQRQKKFVITQRDIGKVFLKSRGTDDRMIINGTNRSLSRKLLPQPYSTTPPATKVKTKNGQVVLYTNGLISK